MCAYLVVRGLARVCQFQAVQNILFFAALFAFSSFAFLPVTSAIWLPPAAGNSTALNDTELIAGPMAAVPNATDDVPLSSNDGGTVPRASVGVSLPAAAPGSEGVTCPKCQITVDAATPGARLFDFDCAARHSCCRACAYDYVKGLLSGWELPHCPFGCTDAMLARTKVEALIGSEVR